MQQLCLRTNATASLSLPCGSLRTACGTLSATRCRCATEVSRLRRLLGGGEMKTCTKCSKAQPLQEFYRRTSQSKQRRSICRTCTGAAAKHRRKHPPLLGQIVRHFVDPSAPLSKEAEEAIYTDVPVDPALVALHEKRCRVVQQRQQRLAREAKRNPLSFAAKAYERSMKE